MVSEEDKKILKRCVELAREAFDAGDAPFGSVLVDGNGKILQEDRNRTVTESDVSLHPEFTLALWAQKNLSPSERAKAMVYTSGEHCPMCSSVHAYVGLGKIFYVSSSEQLVQWTKELGNEPGSVASLAINQVAPGLTVEGPVAGLDEEVKELHRLRKERRTSSK